MYWSNDYGYVRGVKHISVAMKRICQNDLVVNKRWVVKEGKELGRKEVTFSTWVDVELRYNS